MGFTDRTLVLDKLHSGVNYSNVGCEFNGDEAIIYIYTHTHIYINIYIHIYKYIYTYIYIYIIRCP